MNHQLTPQDIDDLIPYYERLSETPKPPAKKKKLWEEARNAGRKQLVEAVKRRHAQITRRSEGNPSRKARPMGRRKVEHLVEGKAEKIYRELDAEYVHAIEKNKQVFLDTLMELDIKLSPIRDVLVSLSNFRKNQTWVYRYGTLYTAPEFLPSEEWSSKDNRKLWERDAPLAIHDLKCIRAKIEASAPSEKVANAEHKKLSLDDNVFFQRLLSASDLPRLNATEMARLQAYLKRRVSSGMMQRAARGDPEAVKERDHRTRLKEILDFNKALPNMPDNRGDMKDINLLDGMKLLNKLREWLDFAMWFIVEYPDNQPVRYDWFVDDYPDGKPGAPNVKARVADRVIIGRQTGDPLTWVTEAIFEGGKKREVDVASFCCGMRGEVSMLVHLIARKTATINKAKLPPWYPRDEILPIGDDLPAIHAGYMNMRKAVLDYYKQLAELYAGQPPWSGFPEPVALPVSASTADTKKAAVEEVERAVTEKDGTRIVDYFLYQDKDEWKCYGTPLRWKKPSDKKCFEMLITNLGKWTTRQQHKSTGLKDSTIKSAITHIRIVLWDILKHRPKYAIMAIAKGKEHVRKTILQNKKTKSRSSYRLCVESQGAGFQLKTCPATAGNRRAVKLKS